MNSKTCIANTIQTSWFIPQDLLEITEEFIQCLIDETSKNK